MAACESECPATVMRLLLLHYNKYQLPDVFERLAPTIGVYLGLERWHQRIKRVNAEILDRLRVVPVHDWASPYDQRHVNTLVYWMCEPSAVTPEMCPRRSARLITGPIVWQAYLSGGYEHTCNALLYTPGLFKKRGPLNQTVWQGAQIFVPLCYEDTFKRGYAWEDMFRARYQPLLRLHAGDTPLCQWCPTNLCRVIDECHDWVYFPVKSTEEQMRDILSTCPC